jgi:hypothetical protein
MIYLIYCKNLCKCHNVPSPSTTINRKKIRKSFGGFEEHEEDTMWQEQCEQACIELCKSLQRQAFTVSGWEPL